MASLHHSLKFVLLLSFSFIALNFYIISVQALNISIQASSTISLAKECSRKCESEFCKANMDPYAIITCLTQEKRSSVASGKGSTPEWNETFLFTISDDVSKLQGFVVWLIERPINEEFQGSRAQQIGTVLWFSFSTLVFAHRERLFSNLSRFVVIVWLFVVLILSSSYTATLTSLLTVQQIQLASNGDYIGYKGFSKRFAVGPRDIKGDWAAKGKWDIDEDRAGMV